MSKELFLGKGSRYRVKKIRWKASELASLILLSLGITAISIGTALWMMSHFVD